MNTLDPMTPYTNRPEIDPRLKNKKFELTTVEGDKFIARRVVDRNRNLVTYQIEGTNIVIPQKHLNAVEELLAAIAEDETEISVVTAQRRRRILDTTSDLVIQLLWEDRKEDEELPRGVIEEAIDAGEITVDEIVQTFANKLRLDLTNSKEES